MEGTLVIDKKPRVVWLVDNMLRWGATKVVELDDVGDAKAKSVDVSAANELTRVASVSPPFGFQFKVGKNEYSLYAKDGSECTAWMKALVTHGAKPSRILTETALELSDQALAKFPKAHLAKQGLQTINLASNQLTKLPEDFGSFGKLEVLDLSSNHLKALPDSFGYLYSLKDLNASENPLTSLPTSFASLTHLGSLNLSANKFTSLPPAIFSLHQLDTFNFSYNTIVTGSLAPELTQLTQLRHLDLSGCGLTSLPDSIGSLTSLRSLELFKNQLTHLPETLANLKLLMRLALGRNKIAVLPSLLPQNLNELDISHNPLLDLPDVLGNMQSLYFEFVECPLTAIPAEHRAHLNTLKAFLASRAASSAPPETAP